VISKIRVSEFERSPDRFSTDFFKLENAMARFFGKSA